MPERLRQRPWLVPCALADAAEQAQGIDTGSPPTESWTPAAGFAHRSLLPRWLTKSPRQAAGPLVGVADNG